MPGPWSLNVRPSLIDRVLASAPLTELHVITLGCGAVKGLIAQCNVMQLNRLVCHNILCHPVAPQSSVEMQGTYTFWGARLFSYLNISVPDDTWIFQVGQNVCHALCCVKSIPLTLYIWLQMHVSSAARLWVNNTLVIDATCTAHVQHHCLHALHSLCPLHSIVWHCNLGAMNQLPDCKSTVC